MRGYEPAEVDRRLAELTAAAEAAEERAAELARQVAELTASEAAARRTAEASHESSYADFGERIGQILLLAQEEAENCAAPPRPR